MHYIHDIYLDTDISKEKLLKLINDTIEKDLDKIYMAEDKETYNNDPCINITIKDKDGNIIENKELSHLDISIFEYNYAKEHSEEILNNHRDKIAKTMYDENYSKYDICNKLKMTRCDLEKALNKK